MKTALITGITGQDGSFLAELLLEKDMTCMALFAAHQWITVNASLTSKDTQNSIYITPTSAIRCRLFRY